MAVSGGDRDAFASLYERYFDRLYDFTVRIVGDRDSAADAVQSTFIKAWRHLQERNVPERVKPWLFAIAHNEAIDETRRRKRFARPGASREDDGLDDELGQIEESRSDNPETALGDREIASLVWRAAQGLNRSDYALLDITAATPPATSTGSERSFVAMPAAAGEAAGPPEVAERIRPSSCSFRPAAGRTGARAPNSAAGETRRRREASQAPQPSMWREIAFRSWRSSCWCPATMPSSTEQDPLAPRESNSAVTASSSESRNRLSFV
jgi:RNA polymerase sigma factor (sigma-70 family)